MSYGGKTIPRLHIVQLRRLQAFRQPMQSLANRRDDLAAGAALDTSLVEAIPTHVGARAQPPRVIKSMPYPTP